MNKRETPTRPTALPVVIALGCPKELAGRCVAAVARGGAVLRSFPFREGTQAIPTWRPLALLVTPDVLAFDAAKISALAVAADAALLVVDAEESNLAELEALVAATVQRRKRGRGDSGVRARSLVPTAAPASDRPSCRPTLPAPARATLRAPHRAPLAATG